MTSTPLFSASYQSYLLGQEARHLSANYRNLQALSCDYWLKLHPDKPMGDYTPDDIRAWLVWLASPDAPGAHPLSSSSVDIHYRCLKSFFLWAEREEILPFGGSAIRKVPRPRHTEKLPDVLSPAETKQLLNAVLKNTSDPNRFRNFCILLTFADTGIRLEELEGLTLDTVNLEQGYARVLGKGDRERIVRIGLELRRALSKYRLQFRKSVQGEPAMFTNDMGFRFDRGGIRSMVVRMLHAHVERPLRKYGPHTLRHTYATLDIMQNNDLEGTSRSMGHRDTQTTMRYVHLAEMLRTNGRSPMDAVMGK